jgi:hypothetical protein
VLILAPGARAMAKTASLVAFFRPGHMKGRPALPVLRAESVVSILTPLVGCVYLLDALLRDLPSHCRDRRLTWRKAIRYQ